MARKPLEPFGIFVGDVHSGSTAAVAPERECRNADQALLLGLWHQMVAEALAEMAGKYSVVFLGGDLVDGPRHHGTFETWGTPKEQRDGAIDLLRPLTSQAQDKYGLIGTEIHAGPKGDDDRAVAEELGCRTARHTWHLTYGGQRLDWAHHGISVPRDVTHEDSGLLAEARRHYELALRGRTRPDLVVRHHAHFMPDPVTRHGITVGVCGCWQLGTAHGYKIGPERTPTLGVLYWYPQRALLVPKRYAVPEAYAEVKIVGSGARV